MGEWFVTFLSGYSWTKIVWLVCFWFLLRLALFVFNCRNVKIRKLKVYWRFTRLSLGGSNYKSAVTRLNFCAGVALLIMAVLVPVGLFVDKARWWWLSQNPMEWGVIGDFFGGMLNPILAFASFIALLYTIRIQSEELRLTREEFAKSVKAQERMAGEAERSRKQSIVLGEYQHVSELLRDNIRSLENLLSKPLHLELSPNSDIGILPVNIFAVIGNLMARFKAKGEEATERERLAEGLDYVENKLKPNVREFNVLLNAVFEFCELSYQLVDLHRMYVDLCGELNIEVKEGSVQSYDLAGVGRFLALSYMLAVPLSLKNPAYLTKHKLHARATTEFNNFLFTFGLTNNMA